MALQPLALIGFAPLAALVIAHMLASGKRSFKQSFVFAAVAFALGTSIFRLAAFLGLADSIVGLFNGLAGVLPAVAAAVITSSTVILVGVFGTEWFTGFKEEKQLTIAGYYIVAAIVIGLVLGGVLSVPTETLQSVVVAG